MTIDEVIKEREAREAALGLETAGPGFTESAEKLNGRLAMIGFLIGLLTEVLTGQGILSQIGLG